MTYRDRREARAERLREWAEKRDVKADAAEAKTRQLADMIPFGQPILVGHHSEGRSRRDAERIQRGMSATVEHSRKADEMRSKADNIEAAAEHAIYSDDGDAIERLEGRIAELEAKRSRIKAYNTSCRKGARDVALLSDAEQADILNVAKHASFQLRENGAAPAYWLSNLSGNLNAQRKRLASLRSAS